LRIERKLHWAIFHVTHWMMPAHQRGTPETAFFAGVERLWPGHFNSQNENAGLKGSLVGTRPILAPIWPRIGVNCVVGGSLKGSQ
jgi:hypothetical protein